MQKTKKCRQNSHEILEYFFFSGKMSGFANLIKVTLILDILAQSTNIFLVSKNTKKRVVEFFFAKVIGFSPLLILLIAAFFAAASADN